MRLVDMKEKLRGLIVIIKPEKSFTTKSHGLFDTKINPDIQHAYEIISDFSIFEEELEGVKPYLGYIFLIKVRRLLGQFIQTSIISGMR